MRAATVWPFQCQGFNAVVEYAIGAGGVDGHNPVLTRRDEHALGSVDEVRGVERQDVSSSVLNAVAGEVNVAVTGVQDFHPLAFGP